MQQQTRAGLEVATRHAGRDRLSRKSAAVPEHAEPRGPSRVQEGPPSPLESPVCKTQAKAAPRARAHRRQASCLASILAGQASAREAASRSLQPRRCHSRSCSQGQEHFILNKQQSGAKWGSGNGSAVRAKVGVGGS